MKETMLMLISETLSNRCLKLYDFISQNSKFLNNHMVDFITRNHWGALSNELQNEMQTQKEGEILKYFENESKLYELKNFSSLPAITKFVSEARENSWQNLMSTSVSFNVQDGNVDTNRLSIYSSSKQKLYRLQISNKKQHEVEIMAEFVAHLARLNETQMVVDFGTGKGYLPSLLSLLYEMKVIGMDSSKLHICNAISRDRRLADQFERAAEKIETNRDDKRSFSGCFTPIEMALTGSTDVSDIIRKSLSTSDSSNIQTVFSGLHACGNLSCSVLRHFVNCSNATSVCVVGCCYHFIEEEFDKETNVLEGNRDYGFPMSNLLRQRRAVIGRNARMLAMQSVERSSITKESRSLFYRSLLQVLLCDYFGAQRYDVGRISVKEGTTFENYVRKALLKLQLHDRIPEELSSERIESYVQDYSEWERKLNAYQELRVVMAPSVECLLLLDRAQYLMEQPNIGKCYLTRLFDPLKSPRCIAVVAVKS